MLNLDTLTILCFFSNVFASIPNFQLVLIFIVWMLGNWRYKNKIWFAVMNEVFDLDQQLDSLIMHKILNLLSYDIIHLSFLLGVLLAITKPGWFIAGHHKHDSDSWAATGSHIRSSGGYGGPWWAIELIVNLLNTNNSMGAHVPVSWKTSFISISCDHNMRLYNL